MKYAPPVIIDSNIKQSTECAEKHIKELLQIYSDGISGIFTWFATILVI